MQLQKMTMITVVFLSGCIIPSSDMTNDASASHIVGKCFELQKNAFVFEGKCADLTGFNTNREFCNSIQVAGEGGFPQSWDEYLSRRTSFDKKTFDKLLFEKQRTMLFELNESTKLTITRVVHHGWGTIGRFWIMRGEIQRNDEKIEIELPSLYLIHPKPYWFESRSKTKTRSNAIPTINIEYLKECRD